MVVEKKFSEISVTEMESLLKSVISNLTSGMEVQVEIDNFRIERSNGGREAIRFIANIGKDYGGW